MIVVKGEDQGAVEREQPLDQGIGQPVRGEDCGGVEQPRKVVERLGPGGAYGGDEVDQEGGEVVVVFVQGEPGVGGAAGGEPAGDEGALAVAGGGGDKDDAAAAACG